MKTKTLILMVGISGSGKSKFIKDTFKNDIPIIEPDDIRRHIAGDVSNMSRDVEVWVFAKKSATKILNSGDSVILDATSVDKTNLMGFIKDVKAKVEYDVTVKLFMFKPDYRLSTTRIKNDLSANKDRSKVPPDVVYKQFQKFERLYRDMKLNPDKYENYEITYVDSKSHKIISEKDFSEAFMDLKLNIKTFDEFKSEGEEEIYYSAIVLDDESQNKLAEFLKNKYPDIKDWKTYADHSTIYMGALDKTDKRLLNKPVNLVATHVAKDEYVIALKVEGNKWTTNKTPHITLATNKTEGGKPVMSNDLVNWEPIDKIELSGTIEEVKKK